MAEEDEQELIHSEAYLASEDVIASNVDQEEVQSSDSAFLELSGKARLIAVILKPVILTMLCVIWVIRSLGESASGTGSASPSIATMAYSESSTDSTSEKFFGSAANALIFIFFITVMTFVFVLLFKYKCFKIIYCWLTFSVATLLGALGGVVFMQLLQAYNLAMDYVTFAIILWNYAIVGLLSIFWESPEQVTHAYLVCVSVFLAFVFNNLPDWTCWMVLSFLIVYDLMAVLCPHGPLRMLVDVAIDQNQTIPGLLYDATIESDTQASGAEQGRGSGSGNEGVANPDVEASPLLNSEEQSMLQESQDVKPENPGNASQVGVPSEASVQPQPQPTEAAQEGETGSDSLKLGLGDFVFYSVLVARAANMDVAITASCFIAVITGLCLTLFLLAIAGKALPALPISLTFGISFYFLGVGFIRYAVFDLNADLLLA